jgi:hypothetical protein
VIRIAQGRASHQARTRVDDKYFTQTLLPDYMEENPEETADWKLDWDARGNFAEPHTYLKRPAGTRHVREYLAGVGAPKVNGARIAKAWVERLQARVENGGMKR